MFTRAIDPWDDVDRALLAACQQPRTLAELAAATGLPADTVKSQIHAHRKTGRVIDHVDSGVRYQLTLTGRVRLLDLTRGAQRTDIQKAA